MALKLDWTYPSTAFPKFYVIRNLKGSWGLVSSCLNADECFGFWILLLVTPFAGLLVWHITAPALFIFFGPVAPSLV
jgi:hypothetical protein